MSAVVKVVTTEGMLQQHPEAQRLFLKYRGNDIPGTEV